MKMTAMAALLLASLLLFQCENEFVGNDQLPTLPPLEDQELVLGKNEYALLDLQKNFRTGASSIFVVENAASLQGKFVITQDGYLVYQAPAQTGREDLRVQVRDIETGQTQEATISMNILNDPVGTGSCYLGLNVLVIGAQPNTVSIEYLTRNDTLCGNTPTGDFEVVFPPTELTYTLNGQQLTVNPNPGGIDLDVMVYKGKYANRDSAYLTVLFLTNQTGCVPFNLDDDLLIPASPDSSSYLLDVMANDIFCQFPRDSSRIVFADEVLGAGTVEVVANGQYLRYTPNPGATFPIQENFTCYVQVKNSLGFRTTGNNVRLRIQ